MNEQQLQSWLVSSDEAASAPQMPPLNAERLEPLAIRRRRRRRGVAIATVSAVLVGVTVLTSRSDRTETRVVPDQHVAAHGANSADTNNPVAEDWRAQLDALEQEIRDRKALVAAMREARNLDRLHGELADLERTVPSGLGPSSLRLRQARDAAAATSLFYAHVLATEFGEDELAAAEYRAIVSRYPNTRWSAEAEAALPADPLDL